MACVRSAGVLAFLFIATPAVADDQIVASLPWDWITAGPNASDYQQPDDSRDLWIIEDFGIGRDTHLTRFESVGTIYPDPPVVFEVTAQVWSAFPPEGHIVISSIPGAGHFEKFGFGNVKFVTDFGAQLLPAGDYWIVWNVSTATGQQKIAIDWAEPGPHKVGGGEPDNAWQWNPNGGWGYTDNLRAIPADLEGNGRIGVNFTIFGQPEQDCYADFTGDGTLDTLDYLAYLNAFDNMDPSADCNADGAIDLFDFLCFVNAFNTGC